MIMEVEVPYRDIRGNLPGRYFVEFQVRTIAMDTWASLEHEIKYKRRVENQAMITSELKKCADELAACDLSLRTIRNLINQKEGE
jgi:putative GTP pyrophosphokinase